MDSKEELIELLRINETVARGFYEVEKRILSILNFRDLFEGLLAEIKHQFKVPYAWISMIDKSDVSSLIHSLESSEILKKHLNVVDKETFMALVGLRIHPLLINARLEPYAQLLPDHRKYFIKSMAIAPISLDGEIIGSLNQADFSRDRFQPGIDTSLLAQLAIKVSICLSNVTAHERLKFLAYHDPLTGLLNRRVMETVLKREFLRDKRYSRMLSVVFLDLDKFKQINDTHGHDRGDELLKYVASQLKSMSRESDIVARFAGDEFVVILPETPAEKAEALMRRLQEFFSCNPLRIGGSEVHASISFGVASTEDGAIKTSQELLKKADEKLYAVKESKKPG